MEFSCLFVSTQQLKGSCQQWMLAEDWDTKEILDLVVLEQFIACH